MANIYVDALATGLGAGTVESPFKTVGDALTESEPGDTIIVSEGIYTETVVVNKDVTILGANSGIGGASDERGAESIIEGGIHILADGVTLDGLKIVDGGSLGENAGVFVQGNGATVTNSLLVRTGTVDGDGFRGVVTAIGGVADLAVTDNQMTGWATGTYLNPGATGTVTGNVYSGNYVGISSDGPNGVTIQSNTFDGSVLEQVGMGAAGAIVDLAALLNSNTFTNSPANGAVFVYGNGENETFTGSSAADRIDGGAGTDGAIYEAGAVIGRDTLGNWTVKVGGVTDTLVNVEKVVIAGKTYLLVDSDGNGGYGTVTGAVAAANDGDTILVASGTYAETVVVNKDVTILGANAGIAGSSSARGAESTIEGGIHFLTSGVTLDGLKIVEGGYLSAGEPKAGVLVQGAGATIANSVFTGPFQPDSRAVVTAASAQDIDVSGNVMNGWANGAYLNPGTTGSVSGNVFEDNNVGLSMDDPAGLVVDGNTFNGNNLEQIGVGETGAALDLSAIVANNTFTSSPVNGAVFVYGNGENQTFVGSSAADRIDGGAGTDGAIYGAGALIGRDALDNWTVTVGGVTDTLVNVEKVVIAGKTYLLVDSDGNGGYGNVGDAVAAANDGDTILVASGIYTETVVVNKDVTILGANAGIAGSSARGSESTIQGGIHILADGVTLDGLKIVDGGSLGENAGVFVQGNGATVTNSLLVRTGTVDGDGFRGVVTAIGGVADLAVTDNQMTGWATGTYLNPGATGTVTGNVYTGNYVGISLDVSGGVSVTGNVLFGNVFENIGVGVYASAIDVGSIVGANTILSGAPVMAFQSTVWDPDRRSRARSTQIPSTEAAERISSREAQAMM